jgi:hypothetical protein
LGTEEQVREERGAAGFMTLRAFILGSVLCAVSAVMAPYWTLYLQTSRLYADYHTAGATFFLFVLLVICNFLVGGLLANALAGLSRLLVDRFGPRDGPLPGLLAWLGRLFWAVGRVLRRVALRAHELMATGAMMLVGGSILSSGLIAYFIPSISSVYYAANTSNNWNEMWQYLPKWASPLDPNGGHIAIKKFWEGLPQGEPIPLDPWLKPLALWGVMLMAFFLLLMAIMVIMRKQWVDYEHLSFPIAQVPGELCAAAEPQAGGGILHSVAFWLGVVFSVLVASAGGAAHYLNSTMEFRVRQWVDLAPGWRLPIYLDVVFIGLVFLIPNRIAFTVWATALLSWVASTFMATYNLALPNEAVYGGEMNHLAMGGTIVFVISSIWLSRGHLKRALRCALGTGDRGYDYGEAASYRLSFAAIVVCTVVVIVWFNIAGLDLGYSIVNVLAVVAIYYAMARVVAQCGLPALSPPAYPNMFLSTLFGPTSIGSRGLGVLALHYGSYFDMRNSVMSGAAHGMYLTRRRRSGLMWAMLFGLVLSYAVACASAVWVCYRKHGGTSMDPWFFGTFPNLPWIWMRSAITQGTGPSFGRLVWLAGGALLMAGLIVAQRTFFWWPLHPVGVLVASSHMVYFFWASVFSAWLIKVIVVGLGGYGAFRKARQFMIGMVLGYFLAGGMWNIVDTITGKTLNSVFYI